MSYLLIVIGLFVIEFAALHDDLNALRVTELDKYYTAWMLMFIANIAGPIAVYSLYEAISGWIKNVERD